MFEYIYKDFMTKAQVFPAALLFGIPAGLLVVLLCNGRRRRKGRPEFHYLPMLLFCVYCGTLLSITLFSRENGSFSGSTLDLQLFSTWGINRRNNAYVIENILLFVPYGILGGWNFRHMRNLFWVSLAGFLTSLTIETVQLVTKRGFFQLDDIVTNLIGTVLGWMVFTIASLVVRRLRASKKSA